MFPVEEPALDKYQLLDGQDGRPLERQTIQDVYVYRIQYLTTIIDPEGKKIAGLDQKGGWLQTKQNLSHHDTCAVIGNAVVMGDVKVWGTSIIEDESLISGSGTLINTHIRGSSQVTIRGGKTFQDTVVENNKVIRARHNLIRAGHNFKCLSLGAAPPPVGLPRRQLSSPERSGLNHTNGDSGRQNPKKTLVKTLGLE